MKRLSYSSLFFLAFLVSCMPAICNCGEPGGDDLRPSYTQLDTRSLVSASTGQRLIVGELGNCLVDEVEVPGEGSRVRGTLGGLALSPNPVGITPESARDLAPTLANLAAPSFEQPSVIIVVDDFNGNTDQPGVYFLDQQRGPTLAGLTSGATEAEVQALEDDGQYAHGTLVFNHTLALLSGLDPNPEFSNLDVFVPEEERTLNLPVATFTRLNVRVVALDTEDFNTEIIAGWLEATIRTLSASRLSRFAVNLSFGLVPCSVLNDIEAAGDLTFEAYAQEVLGANDLDANTFRDDLVNILTTPVGSDPLQGVVDLTSRGLGDTLEVNYIAAAGNYRLPYALFPGYWSEFVSVSAMNLASATPVKDPDYSNTGEVLLEGGYFILTGYDPATGGWRDYPQISVTGTSFAAPVLSVFTALDFTNPVPRCARNSGEITTPLAFFKTDPPILTPSPALDLPLSRALSDYCMLE